MELKYVCFHIPTGQSFNKSQTFISLSKAQEAIDNWNRQGKGTWQYWSL